MRPKWPWPLTYDFTGHYQICRGEKEKCRGFYILILQSIEIKLFRFQNVPDIPTAVFPPFPDASFDFIRAGLDAAGRTQCNIFSNNPAFSSSTFKHLYIAPLIPVRIFERIRLRPFYIASHLTFYFIISYLCILHIFCRRERGWLRRDLFIHIHTLVRA